MTVHPDGVEMGEGDVDIAAAAALLADETRSRILVALAGGGALPAGELARMADVTAGTASQHLSKLTAAGWLTVEQQGRHRYYRISRQDVLDLVESLANVAPVHPVRSLRGSRIRQTLRIARTCYDHLGGAVSVAVFDRLRSGDGLTFSDDAWWVNPNAHVFTAMGLSLPSPRSIGRRPMVRVCLDWSQRRHHLSGAVGAAVLVHMVEQGWCERSTENRSVTITDTGWSALDTTLGIRRDAVLAMAS